VVSNSIHNSPLFNWNQTENIRFWASNIVLYLSREALRTVSLRSRSCVHSHNVRIDALPLNKKIQQGVESSNLEPRTVEPRTVEPSNRRTGQLFLQNQIWGELQPGISIIKIRETENLQDSAYKVLRLKCIWHRWWRGPFSWVKILSKNQWWDLPNNYWNQCRRIRWNPASCSSCYFLFHYPIDHWVYFAR